MTFQGTERIELSAASVWPARMRRWAPVAMGLLLLYWLAMFTGTHHPHPPAMPTEHFDKVLHFCGFGGLGVLLVVVWSLRGALSLGHYLFFASVIACYAAFDEITQMLVPTRSCEFLDWCADFTGGMLGLAFGALAIGLLRRSTRGATGAIRNSA